MIQLHLAYVEHTDAYGVRQCLSISDDAGLWPEARRFVPALPVVFLDSLQMALSIAFLVGPDSRQGNLNFEPRLRCGPVAAKIISDTERVWVHRREGMVCAFVREGAQSFQPSVPGTNDPY